MKVNARAGAADMEADLINRPSNLSLQRGCKYTRMEITILHSDSTYHLLEGLSFACLSWSRAVLQECSV